MSTTNFRFYSTVQCVSACVKHEHIVIVAANYVKKSWHLPFENMSLGQKVIRTLHCRDWYLVNFQITADFMPPPSTNAWHLRTIHQRTFSPKTKTTNLTVSLKLRLTRMPSPSCAYNLLWTLPEFTQRPIGETQNRKHQHYAHEHHFLLVQIGMEARAASMVCTQHACKRCRMNFEQYAM